MLRLKILIASARLMNSELDSFYDNRSGASLSVAWTNSLPATAPSTAWKNFVP